MRVGRRAALLLGTGGAMMLGTGGSVAMAAPPTRMVAFPSRHAEVVVASTSTREITYRRALRVVYIAERGSVVSVRVRVSQAGRSWQVDRVGVPAAAGGQLIGVPLPPAARAPLLRCLPATVAVQAFVAGSRAVIRDKVRLLADQAACTPRPPSFAVPARPPAGDRGLALPSAFAGESPALMARDLEAARQLRTSWLRVPIEWPRVEPRAGSRDWSAVDRAVGGAARRRIGTLGLITYAPPWAQAPGAGYPRDPVRFAAFAARVAARYSPYGVRHWEIWNEPNFAHFWRPNADPVTYARMLRLTSLTLHAVEPRAVVLLGGLGRVDFDGTSLPANLFLEQALVSGVLPQTDAIAVHPYSYPFSPGDPSDNPRNAWRLIGEPVDGLLALMRLADQASKPLWITEFGAPDQGSGQASGAPDGVGEVAQAQLVAALYGATRGTEWAGPAFWYAERDLALNGASTENSFGLLRADFSDKPAAGVFRAVAP